MAYRSSTTTSTTATTAITGTDPAGTAAGDRVYAIISQNGDSSDYLIAPDSSWRQVAYLRHPAGVTTGQTTWVYEKRNATGGGADSYAFVSSSTNSATIQVASFSGRRTTTSAIISTTLNTVDNATPVNCVISGLTAAAKDDILVFTFSDETTAADVWSFSQISGYTLRQNDSTGATTVAINTLDNVAAGATGDLSTTLTRTSGTTGTGYGGVVISIPVLPTISISSQPTNQNVNLGSTANFSITATGVGSLSYQWQDTSISGTFNNVTSGTGSTTSSYTTSSVVPSMQRLRYRCLVTDDTSVVQSSSALLGIESLNPVYAVSDGTDTDYNIDEELYSTFNTDAQLVSLSFLFLPEKNLFILTLSTIEGIVTEILKITSKTLTGILNILLSRIKSISKITDSFLDLFSLIFKKINKTIKDVILNSLLISKKFSKILIPVINLTSFIEISKIILLIIVSNLSLIPTIFKNINKTALFDLVTVSSIFKKINKSISSSIFSVINILVRKVVFIVLSSSSSLLGFINKKTDKTIFSDISSSQFLVKIFYKVLENPTLFLTSVFKKILIKAVNPIVSLVSYIFNNIVPEGLVEDIVFFRTIIARSLQKVIIRSRR